MAKPLPDIVAQDLSVIFAGLNPGLSSAAAAHHFSHGSTRFWKALHLSGFTPTQLRPEDDGALPRFGLGLTTVVARPTRGGNELKSAEFVEAATDLAHHLEHLRPKCVAFLGKAAYAAIVGRRDIPWGLQPDRFGTAIVWVLPNPSGRNRAFTLNQLVQSYRDLRLFIESDARAH
ncbi:MAG TPA: G/U mismatch-specific DNA glycosylase [Gemmatimonadaceae bacterium]|jgi:TDG/mug DNA glycosylase family protein